MSTGKQKEVERTVGKADRRTALLCTRCALCPSYFPVLINYTSLPLYNLFVFPEGTVEAGIFLGVSMGTGHSLYIYL